MAQSVGIGSTKFNAMPRLTDPHIFGFANHFGGGGAPKPPKEKPIKMPEMPPMNIPAPPKPAPPPPPPPTQSAMEVEEAKTDQRRQAARRQGTRQTLIAGETGGYNNPATGGKSLLG